MPAPEVQARQDIDAQLCAAGWQIQDYKKVNLAAGRGVALREVPLKNGTCDYLLLADGQPVGVIEAKKVGMTLSGVAEQSGSYAAHLPDFLAEQLSRGLKKLPFAYESTGMETFFRDERDPHPRPRRVFTFHQPQTLAAWLESGDSLRARLAALPRLHPLNVSGLRACQVEAITSLEKSLADGQPRALIQMATGSGKTFTACAFAYRLIKHAGAKNILFLVDRANLGRQAKGEFDQFVTPDSRRKFTELYNVRRLRSNQLDGVARVTISTIQRLYSMLRGEPELAEGLDDRSTADLSAADAQPREVVYNPAMSPETFDFIVIDECHRSIYNQWRQVLDYFDAFHIGLTATPSKQTVAFFNQNLVMEYGHERAVAAGINVGYDVYRIKTEVSESGGLIEKGYCPLWRNKQTRARRQAQLDDDFAYAAKDLDRSVVNPSQIRTVIAAFKDALSAELFPGRAMVPKTLIFAKDDSHAEDIVHAVWEVFGRGFDFCKKITYQSKTADGKPADGDTLIAEFRNSPALRVAVTVDMIATGTDIKPLECLLFMRDVRSANYFEQMKGRGTRVLTPTELQNVSGADARAKTHFVIVDAVGVCESDKSESRPLAQTGKNVSLEKLLTQVALNKRDEQTLTVIAGRLARLDREITPADREQLKTLAGGESLADIAAKLLAACDPDHVAEQATGKRGASPDEITREKFAAAQKQLADDACRAIATKPEFRALLVKTRGALDQVIDSANPDRVIAQGFDASAKAKAAGLVKTFREYIEQHRAEITALQILFSRPYKQRLTEPQLKELERKLHTENAMLDEDHLWQAFSLAKPGKVKGRSLAKRFADLIPLVRFALEQQPELRPFAETVNERFNNWLMDKAKAGVTFSVDQRAWLELICKHITVSIAIEPDDFEYAPFKQRGGLGRAHEVFGDGLNELLEELNEVLVA